ncbi:MAG: hypothetical protein ABH840_03985 [Nanoarchaeota archaeon]
MTHLYSKKVIGIELVIGILFILMISSVGADIEWGNPTQTIFYTGFEGYICSDDGMTWTRSESWGSDITSTLNDCYKTDSFDVNLVPLNTSACCPSDKPICRENSSNLGQYNCVQDTVHPVFSCEDYDTAHCGNANDLAFEQLTNSNYFAGTGYYCDYFEQRGDCGINVNCICKADGGSCKPDGRVTVWNGTTRLHQGSLSSSVNYSLFCGETVEIGDCLLDITKTDECNTTNSILLSSTPTWNSLYGDKPEWCVANSKRLPCVAQLNFINPLGLIIAIVLIIILYYYLSRRKVKGKKVKKK